MAKFARAHLVPDFLEAPDFEEVVVEEEEGKMGGVWWTTAGLAGW